jgi:hypothetical protein
MYVHIQQEYVQGKYHFTWEYDIKIGLKEGYGISINQDSHNEGLGSLSAQFIRDFLGDKVKLREFFFCFVFREDLASPCQFSFHPFSMFIPLSSGGSTVVFSETVLSQSFLSHLKKREWKAV